MGAETFCTAVYKGSSYRDAYNNAVSEATAEFGHDGYNGTISTTSGVRQAPGVYYPMTESAAAFHGEVKVDDDCQKWQSVCAIPVAKDTDFTYRTERFTVETPAIIKAQDSWDRDRPVNQWDLHDKARREAFNRYGMVHEIKVDPQIKAITSVESTQGRWVTRYEVAGARNSQTYATKAQAAKAAETAMSDYSNKVTIKAVRAYELPDGSYTTDAAVVTRQAVSAKANVTVKVATAKGSPNSPKIIGWVFYGIAAC